MTDDDIVKNIPDPPENDESVFDWLSWKMDDGHPWLLAHGDDGVIWGKKTGDKLVTSHEINPDISPPLRGLTLWQAFVFGEESEIRLYRDELGNWKAVEISDPENKEDKIVEDRILWGDTVKPQKKGFSHLTDKAKKGMDHIPPIIVPKNAIDKEAGLYVRLRVHHFVEYDQDTGEAGIGLSRLVRIGIWEDENSAYKEEEA